MSINKEFVIRLNVISSFVENYNKEEHKGRLGYTCTHQLSDGSILFKTPKQMDYMKHDWINNGKLSLDGGLSYYSKTKDGWSYCEEKTLFSDWDSMDALLYMSNNK